MLLNTSKFLINSQKHKIITQLSNYLDSCDEFVISVAFITQSGVTCILESLRKLEQKGIKGKILTGCYLNFTDPKALRKLQSFTNIEIKVITEQNFHAKGFFFRCADKWRMIIGSTNLTQSALTVNTEWNVDFVADSIMQKSVFSEFDNLFENATDLENIIDEYESFYDNAPKIGFNPNIKQQIQPNAIQKEALINLTELRQNSQNKALIISATGTGKTFLSAFDVAAVRPSRCLFIVHRTNIAEKARQTFAKVIKDKSLGLFTGVKKENTDYLFATVQTLSNPQTLQQFAKDEFDYIIIDEVHHAEANSYQKVLGYFEPKFLLGMTATPERNDGGDIFKLFDYNIAYEIRLHQALEQDILCPFHYFGIEDFYLENEKQLARDFTKLVSDDRVEHIVKNMRFYGYCGDAQKTLMFVSNIYEAQELEMKFLAKGIKAKALTSQTAEKDRDIAICELESGRLELIITVDIFNEGVDIPSLNQVVMLRPTQSAIVYIQQLGRGLRKAKGKDFVVVLDFIANYENNFLIPIALSQDNSFDKDNLKQFVVSPTDFIAGQSTITFTDVAKEIVYTNIQKTNFSQLKNIKRDFAQLQKELGRVPRLLDFENYNFISPVTILEYKDTYYDTLKSLKVKVPELTLDEYNILKFISKEFSPAKRIYETIILEILLEYKSMDISELKQMLQVRMSDFDCRSFDNALKHLSLDIFTINAGRSEYQPLIVIRSQKVELSPFDMINQNAFLKKQVSDLLEFNKVFYTQKYSQNKQFGLARDVKYSKKDIAHLLNLDYTNGGVNLAGYRFVDDKALLFMTFDESKKFVKYDNRFINRETFTFYSKNNKQLNSHNSTNETALADNKYHNLIFVRVNKSDEYYFLGIAKCVLANDILDNNICYKLCLERCLSPQRWQYFINIQQNKTLETEVSEF